MKVISSAPLPVIAEVIAAFTQDDQMNVEKLPHESEQYIKAKAIEGIFTRGVDLLRTAFPQPHIRTLMSYAWNVIGNRHVNLGIGPNVPTLSVAILVNKQAAIFIPHNWIEMTKDNPIEQLGAIVFVGSQATDIYNERALVDLAMIQTRARAYEAEYLLGLQGFKPTPYQQALLTEFPQGVASLPPDALYVYKPVTLLS